LKKHNLTNHATSGHKNQMLMGRWGRKSPNAWRFKKFFIKIPHFRHASAKI